MIVDISDVTVREYQDTRLKEKASPKTINEEVGFLLRLIGDRGVVIRSQLKGKKALKLKGSRKVAKALSTDEKSVSSKPRTVQDRRRSIRRSCLLSMQVCGMARLGA